MIRIFLCMKKRMERMSNKDEAVKGYFSVCRSMQVFDPCCSPIKEREQCVNSNTKMKKQTKPSIAGGRLEHIRRIGPCEERRPREGYKTNGRNRLRRVIDRIKSTLSHIGRRGGGANKINALGISVRLLCATARDAG